MALTFTPPRDLNDLLTCACMDLVHLQNTFGFTQHVGVKSWDKSIQM